MESYDINLRIKYAKEKRNTREKRRQTLRKDSARIRAILAAGME
jgi:hypothetical protein